MYGGDSDYALFENGKKKIEDSTLVALTIMIAESSPEEKEMSGSPIIQDGKLVGAVTHVLVNDPTRGYGIFAQTMLEQAHSVAGMDVAA